MEQILKLKEEQINKMDFNKIMTAIQLIDDYFKTSNSKLDVETALKAYQKAVQLLTAARTKLITFEKDKEKIDMEYEAFVKGLSGKDNVKINNEEDPDNHETGKSNLPF